MAWNALYAEVEIMYKETIKTAGNKMDKTIANIQNDLATLRAGRANPKILDKKNNAMPL